MSYTLRFDEHCTHPYAIVDTEKQRAVASCVERAEAEGIIVALSHNAPVPMLLWCPQCRSRHVDKGEFATKHHHTHACQRCGNVWRPAIVNTVGVQFLPGYKDAD